MEELEFTRNTYTSVFCSKTALTRPRTGAQSSPRFSFLAREPPAFLLAFSRWRAADRACTKLSFSLAPLLLPLLSNIRPKQRSTHVSRETMGFLAQGAPLSNISLSLSPSLCRCVFHSRFLRNRIENNRNRNQYTRYIAIIRAIVNDNILHLKRRVDSHGAINIIWTKKIYNGLYSCATSEGKR